MTPAARFLLNVITFKGFSTCEHTRRVLIGMYGGERCVDCGASWGDTAMKRRSYTIPELQKMYENVQRYHADRKFLKN